MSGLPAPLPPELALLAPEAAEVRAVLYDLYDAPGDERGPLSPRYLRCVKACSEAEAVARDERARHAVPVWTDDVADRVPLTYR